MQTSKMNAFFVIYVALVAGSHGANLNLHPSELEKAAFDCVEESGVSVDVIKAAANGQVTEDEGLKKYLFCFLNKGGIVDGEGKIAIDADGNVDVEKALSKIPPGADKDKVAKALQSCKRQSIWKV